MNKPNLKQILLIILFIVITLLTLFQTIYSLYLFFTGTLPLIKELIELEGSISGIFLFDVVNIFLRLMTLWLLYISFIWLGFRQFKNLKCK